MQINIKPYLSALLLSAVLFSCSNDDDSDIGQPDIPEQGSASATLSFPDVFYGPGDTFAGFVANLEGDASTARQVRVTTQIGPLANYGLGVAPANSNTASGTIALPNVSSAELSFNETGEFPVQIEGVRQGTLVEDEESGDLVFTATGGDTVATTGEGLIPIFDLAPSLNTNGLEILYDWENPEINDIDLEIIDAGFTGIFDSSGSSTRYEDVLTVNSDPDQDYVLYVRIFTDSPEQDINNRLFFISPTGEKTLLTFVLPAGSPTATRLPVAIYTKSTVDGQTVYSDIEAL